MTEMQASSVLDKVGAVKDAMTVSRAFGESYQVDGITIIPVATVRGGGAGRSDTRKDSPSGDTRCVGARHDHREHPHEAEDGTSTPMPLARSRHASVRSLERYARPSPEAVARHVALTDPAARRRRLER